jgi:regulatory associated protein of mTOR
MRTIRLWDARTELLAGSFPTQAGSNLTSLSADESSGGDIFVAGFGDGVIRVFDKRVGLAETEETGLIKVMRQHNTWLQSVWLRNDGELITGR